MNVTEIRRGNQEWTIQRNWQDWVHKTQDKNKQNKKHNTIYVGDLHTQDTKRRQAKQKHNTICVGHHYTQTNTNNVNKK
jgi:hypothetical protein